MSLCKVQLEDMQLWTPFSLNGFRFLLLIIAWKENINARKMNRILWILYLSGWSIKDKFCCYVWCIFQKRGLHRVFTLCIPMTSLLVFLNLLFEERQCCDDIHVLANFICPQHQLCSDIYISKYLFEAKVTVIFCPQLSHLNVLIY